MSRRVFIDAMTASMVAAPLLGIARKRVTARTVAEVLWRGL